MLPRGARRCGDRCNMIYTSAVRNFSNSELAPATGIKIFQPLAVLPSARFSRTDFGVASPKPANFRDHLTNMCSAVLVRRALPIHTCRSLKNKKNLQNDHSWFSHGIIILVFFLYRQRQHIPSGLGRLEKDRGRPLASHRWKGADVSDERPERRRLSQLRQSAAVRRQTIVRVRYRSVLTAMHVERGKCIEVTVKPYTIFRYRFK